MGKKSTGDFAIARRDDDFFAILWKVYWALVGERRAIG